jgi:hypothetical protein
MDTWRGHFPITNFVLHALLKKQTGTGATGFSRAESVLLAACQFWAAVATRELALYLEWEPVPRLLVAFEAFSEIGAVRVASALRLVLGTCPQVPSSAWLQQRSFELEGRLLDTEDAVDHLIAQFASEHMTNEASEMDPMSEYPLPYSPRRPTPDDPLM